MLPSPRALGLIVLSAATGACLTPNPGFDPSAGATSTGTPATTSTGPTTGLTATTGITDTSTSDLSTSTQTTGLVEPTSDPGTTTDETTGTTSTGTTTTGTTSDATTSTGDTTGETCVGIPGDMCQPVQIGRASYLLCEQGALWAKAVEVCAAHCMRLVILDQDESDALQLELTKRMTALDKAAALTIVSETQLTSLRASWWIGGYKDVIWLWVDDTKMPLTGQGGWANNNPDIKDEDVDACAAIAVFGKGLENGDWFDRVCGDIPYRFICEPL